MTETVSHGSDQKQAKRMIHLITDASLINLQHSFCYFPLQSVSAECSQCYSQQRINCAISDKF